LAAPGRREWTVGLTPLVLLLGISTAPAQRPGCGYGDALAALRSADLLLAAAPALPDLATARHTAMSAAERLRSLGAVLQGCGCVRTTAGAADAAEVAEAATAEPSVAGIAVALDRARWALRLVRDRLDRNGCS
jgi:hypothetical protein